MRNIIFTGKGGVGKTSVAAATALRAADMGYKTLIMSTDPDIAINEIYKVFGGHIGLTTEIKGNPASKGKVSGPVKIILSDKDFIKFESGDILVTSMTRPEFIPLMKMAKAVVTDEGGITCHAAIISRELGLPCIIGTKVGTRILKDGDLVEVDANNGIVKIIK